MRASCCAIARALVAFLVLELLTGSVRASEVRPFALGNTVGGVVTYTWPESCHRGWVPVFLELRNESDQPQEIQVSAVAPWSHHGMEIEGAVVLAPRESRRVELLYPLLAENFDRELTLTLRLGGETASIPAVGPAQAPHPASRACLILRPSLESPNLPANVVGEWLAGSGSGSASDGGSRMEFAQVAFAEAARSWQAYTCVDLVLVEAQADLPDAEVLEALARYVRSGGTVAFLGPHGERALRAHERFAPYLEERFEVGSGTGDADLRGHAMGLGLVLSGPVILAEVGEAEGRLLGRAVAADRSFAPSVRLSESRASLQMPRLAGLGEVPVRSLIGFLVVFVILIGPLNLWLVQKVRKPVLMLVNVPVLAFAFSAALIGFNFAREGFEARIAARSLSVIDQRDHRRATAECLAFYAPLGLGSGLDPGGSTAVLPVLPEQGSRAHRFILGGLRGERLSGDFLPTRRPTRMVRVVEDVARERLSFEPEGDSYRVTNLLGSAIREMELRDRAGHSHVLALPIGPGASATLVRVAGPVRGTGLFARLAQGWEAPADLLPVPERPSRYVALLERPSWLDRSVIRGEEDAGEHWVVGILPLAPEEWR